MAAVAACGGFGAIILGLSFGFFTSTPAVSVGVFVIAFYGFTLRGLTGEDLNFGGLLRVIRATTITSGMIYRILFWTEVPKGFFTRNNLPQVMSEWAARSRLSPMILLIPALTLFVSRLIERLGHATPLPVCRPVSRPQHFAGWQNSGLRCISDLVSGPPPVHWGATGKYLAETM